MKIADNDQKQACNSSGTISSKVTFPRSRSDSSQQKDFGKPHWRWWCYQICGHTFIHKSTVDKFKKNRQLLIVRVEFGLDPV